MGLHGEMAYEWNKYFTGLRHRRIRLFEAEYSIVWSWENEEYVSAKSLYEAISYICTNYNKKWWYKKIWKWHLPLKLKCFLWLCLENRILTWDNLIKHGW